MLMVSHNAVAVPRKSYRRRDASRVFRSAFVAGIDRMLARTFGSNAGRGGGRSLRFRREHNGYCKAGIVACGQIGKAVAIKVSHSCAYGVDADGRTQGRGESSISIAQKYARVIVAGVARYEISLAISVEVRDCHRVWNRARLKSWPRFEGSVALAEKYRHRARIRVTVVLVRYGEIENAVAIQVSGCYGQRFKARRRRRPHCRKRSVSFAEKNRYCVADAVYNRQISDPVPDRKS